MTQTVWRIVQAHLTASAFSGEGAKKYPGRWNHRGTAMVYSAGSLSLAVLEMLVHLGASAPLHRYVAFSVRFDEGLCRVFRPDELPADWAEDPPSDSTRDIGTVWAKSGASLLLAVPSAVVPQEKNYLINPAHPDFRSLEIGPARPFPLNHRLGLKQGLTE